MKKISPSKCTEEGLGKEIILSMIIIMKKTRDITKCVDFHVFSCPLDLTCEKLRDYLRSKHIYLPTQRPRTAKLLKDPCHSTTISAHIDC